MYKKITWILLITFLLSGSSCQLIYPNRVPVVQAKKRYAWYSPNKQRRNRTRMVWMKVHNGGRYTPPTPQPTSRAQSTYASGADADASTFNTTQESVSPSDSTLTDSPQSP